MRDVATESRRSATEVLLQLVDDTSDTVQTVLGPGEKTIDWLLLVEEKKWRREIINRKTLAYSWIISGIVPAVLSTVFLPTAFAASPPVYRAIAMISLAVLLACFLAALYAGGRGLRRARQLEENGHVEESVELFAHFGRSVWLVGINAFYLLIATEYEGQIERRAVRLEKTELDVPTFFDSQALKSISLHKYDGAFVTNLIYAPVDKHKATLDFESLKPGFLHAAIIDAT